MHFNLFDSQGEGAKKEDHKKTRYSRTSCRTQIFFFFPMIPTTFFLNRSSWLHELKKISQGNAEMAL